ncbi:hypothetical protein Tco_1294463 [Tanacetum coccineum]
MKVSRVMLSALNDSHDPVTLLHNPLANQELRVISFTVKMEILIEPTSKKLMVGDLCDFVWIKLVTTGKKRWCDSIRIKLVPGYELTIDEEF